MDRAEALGDVMVCQHFAGVLVSLGQGIETHDLDHINAVVFRILDHAHGSLVRLQIDGVEQIASHGQHPHFSITTAAAKNEGGGAAAAALTPWPRRRSRPAAGRSRVQSPDHCLDKAALAPMLSMLYGSLSLSLVDRGLDLTLQAL